MPGPSLSTILERLLSGYYPDCSGRDFHWRLDSREDRYVIRVTDTAAAKARRMLRRERIAFHITEDERPEEVLHCLMDESIRPHTWLKAPVAEVYRTLGRAGLLKTYEAVDPRDGRLAGALIGVQLGRVFLADTMFQLAGGASKSCLCRLVIDQRERGGELIDVQNAHEDPAHPARRLGEERIGFDAYLAWLRRAQA